MKIDVCNLKIEQLESFIYLHVFFFQSLQPPPAPQKPATQAQQTKPTKTNKEKASEPEHVKEMRKQRGEDLVLAIFHLLPYIISMIVCDMIKCQFAML